LYTETLSVIIGLMRTRFSTVSAIKPGGSTRLLFSAVDAILLAISDDDSDDDDSDDDDEVALTCW